MRRLPGSFVASGSFLVVVASLLAPAASGQLLDPYSASMTTYLPAATAVQGAMPQAIQRGVGLDGAMRAGSTLPFAVAGNPFENAWTGHERQGDLRLDAGSYSPTDVDIALPAPGFSYVIGRSYNALQKSGGSFIDSDGPMGKDWFQSSQPEIVFYDDADNAKDVLYLVYGADRYVEFVRKTSGSNQFKGRNGATGCFDYVSGSPDTWVLTDTMGTKFYFLGFNTSSHTYDGQLWKIVDTDQNTAYVGDASSPSTAISSGFDGSGRVLKAYDSAARRFTFAYTSSSYGGKTRLESVIAETKSGANWSSPGTVTEVYRVEYSYYGNESHGDGGDLKMVKTTMPLSDSGVTLVKKKLYRYWEGSSDGTSSYGSTVNGETAKGYVHQLKYVYDSEGLRRYDYAGDATFDEDFLTASDETLKSYAEAYLEYDSNHKVSLAWFNGQCGCGGGTNGTHEFTYDVVDGYTNNTGYDATMATRTIVERPDGTYLTQYFDEVGQGLSQVITDAVPTSFSKFWLTKVTRDSAGCVKQISTPANVTAYAHNPSPAGQPTMTADGSTGLVWVYTRSGSGSMTGFVTDRKWRAGDNDVGDSTHSYLDASYTWTSKTKTITDVDVVRPLVATSVAYPLQGTDSTGALTTSYSYDEYDDDTDVSFVNKAQSLVIETTTTTPPTVLTTENGAGGANVTYVHRRKDHLVDIEKSASGRMTYHSYTNGRQTDFREDANTYSLTSVTAFRSANSGELDRRTETSFDQKGVQTKQTQLKGTSDERAPYTYQSKLADGRLVTLDFPHFTTGGTTTYYGPVRFTVSNHAGRTEASGILKLTGNSTTSATTSFVDETDADPITALDLGTVAQMTVEVYNDPGVQLSESRRYFLIPASGAGNDTSNYDVTKYGYDDMGRQRRVKEPTGTIRRTVFDTLGRVSERTIGTNDSSSSGGESSGTDNMVTTELVEYDGSASAYAGNSLVTKRTARVEATNSNERVTTYSHDLRGRVLLETTPTAPYALHKYDNMGRRVATGLFSSTASITVGTTDPTSATTNRLALSETFYDEMGRAWKSVRHKIDASDGSDDDSLETLTWFDKDGRVVKVDGEELKKTKYDNLGRVTDEYVLAKDNDSTEGDPYAATQQISGDIVLEERQTRYQGVSDEVILSVRIDRVHSDYGTNATGEPAGSHPDGRLDEDDDHDPLYLDYDGDVRGRAQITASVYDSFGRLTDRMEYGTNAEADFDRDPIGGYSTPARSDTILRTTWTYNTDGTTKSVEDPRGLKTFWVYDALGRQVREVKNWNGDEDPGDYEPTADSSGIAGSVTNAQNVTVKYEYSKGLRTKLTAYLPSGETAQDTVYSYGTTKGASAGDSKIATGHLLQKVTYPDSTGAGDDVTFAYNVQAQEMWKEDQGGNIFETDFDAAGRVTHKRVTTPGSGFDTAVLRISTVYDSLGRTSTVTQYNNATVGSGSATDGVKYTYDGWGNVETFRQDRDSAVDAGGSVNDYTVSYTYAKQTTGRNTIRRATVTLPSGKVITYSYASRSGLYDNATSRVTDIKDGALVLVTYDYNGVGQVVGTGYPEPELYSRLYDGSSPPVYDGLDSFSRVVKSRWMKDLGSPVYPYHVELTYDRDSNITSADDLVHTGFDVKYTMDDTNRLVRAEEGTLSSGSITSRTRDQQWTLSGTGNWKRDKVDLNGDGDFVDTDEVNDTRSHNDVNELTARDTDSNSSPNYSLTYDAAGNQTDDGKDYKYEYDAFYRLRKVKQTGNSALVAEYRYNGLGFKIAEHADTDTDGDVDSNDKWYYDAFDERWRQVSRFRESDTSPKEEFVAHAAGAGGRGGSSYIDLVICRYKDANTAWTSASDGVLEERLYYCQNQHADVVAIVGSDGTQKEGDRYSAYGVPFGLPGGDCDSDGDCDSADATQVQTWIDAPAYDVRGDVDLDGSVTASDKTIVQSAFGGVTLGRNMLSGTVVGNIIAVGGYRSISDGVQLKAVRRRVYSNEIGYWTARDILGYQDSASLYEHVLSLPQGWLDPTGMFAQRMCVPHWSKSEGEATCWNTQWRLVLREDPDQTQVTPGQCPPDSPGCHFVIKGTRQIQWYNGHQWYGVDKDNRRQKRFCAYWHLSRTCGGTQSPTWNLPLGGGANGMSSPGFVFDEWVGCGSPLRTKTWEVRSGELQENGQPCVITSSITAYCSSCRWIVTGFPGEVPESEVHSMTGVTVNN